MNSKSLIASLLCLALAACGGGGSSAPAVTTPPPAVQSGTLQLVAGDVGNTASAPSGIAVDSAGNLYVADTNNNDIRKITPAGVVTTLAGNPGIAGSADGTGTAATFNSPSGIAVDAAGNLYVADTGNFTIRKITSAGVVSTLAGQAGVSGGADGIGAAATFCAPTGIAVSATGNIYVVDGRPYSCHLSASASAKAANKEHAGQREASPPPPGVVRKITAAAQVTTLPVITAGTYDQFGIAVDAAGNLYVAGDNGITFMNTAGAVFLIGNATDGPGGIAVDAAGNLYVADTPEQIISKTPAGTPFDITLAGTQNVAGSADGTGTAATFNLPSGIAVDASGNVYVVDSGNGTIRKITQAGVVTTIAGTAGINGNADGTGSAAQFYPAGAPPFIPQGVTADSAGNLYVTSRSSIVKIATNGAMTVLPGTTVLCSVNQAPGTPGVATGLCNPIGITIDGAGNLYIANTGNSNVLKLAPDGVVTPVAGTPLMLGEMSGVFFTTHAIVSDASGNLYVTDPTTIKKVSTTGVVTTLAGNNSGIPGSTDGIGTVATFSYMFGIALDATGNVYVTDTGNGTIRKMTPDTTVTTIAGMAGVSGSADGTGAAARFLEPTGIAVDAKANLYVADQGNSTIRMITPGGVVTTIAGVAGKAQTMVGNLPGGIASPNAIALIDQNTFAITAGNAVLKLTLPH